MKGLRICAKICIFFGSQLMANTIQIHLYLFRLPGCVSIIFHGGKSGVNVSSSTSQAGLHWGHINPFKCRDM